MREISSKRWRSYFRSGCVDDLNSEIFCRVGCVSTDDSPPVLSWLGAQGLRVEMLWRHMERKKAILCWDDKMCLPCDCPWEQELGKWLATKGCFDYQEDSSLAKLRKPSAPLRIRRARADCSELCPGVTGGCVSAWAPLVTQTVKNLLPAMQETQAWFLGQEEPLEKRMATRSNILTWRIPWTGSLAAHSLWGHKESDTTESLTHLLSLQASVHRVLQGDLQNPHLFPSLCNIGNFVFYKTRFSFQWELAMCI